MFCDFSMADRTIYKPFDLERVIDEIGNLLGEPIGVRASSPADRAMGRGGPAQDAPSRRSRTVRRRVSWSNGFCRKGCSWVSSPRRTIVSPG